MIDPKDQPKVAAFFKEAFNVDGEVEFLSPQALRGLILTHSINVMRLEDSVRGVFYVGCFKPKATNNHNH